MTSCGRSTMPGCRQARALLRKLDPDHAQRGGFVLRAVAAEAGAVAAQAVEPPPVSGEAIGPPSVAGDAIDVGAVRIGAVDVGAVDVRAGRGRARSQDGAEECNSGKRSRDLGHDDLLRLRRGTSRPA